MQRFAGYWVPVEGWPLSVPAKKNDSESHDQPRHVASFIQSVRHSRSCEVSQAKPLLSGAVAYQEISLCAGLKGRVDAKWSRLSGKLQGVYDRGRLHLHLQGATTELDRGAFLLYILSARILLPAFQSANQRGPNKLTAPRIFNLLLTEPSPKGKRCWRLRDPLCALTGEAWGPGPSWLPCRSRFRLCSSVSLLSSAARR